MLTQAYLEGLSGSSTFTVKQPSQSALPSLPGLVPGSVQFGYNSAGDLNTISVGGFITPTTVPEPGSLLLLLIGLPPVAFIGSRRASRM